MNFDKFIKTRNQMAKDIDADAAALVKKIDAFVEADMNAYKALPKADCMFSDSPIAGNRTVTYFRRYVAKLGWHWAINLNFGASEVKPFSVEMKEGSDWVAKCSPKDQGIDKLV